MFRDHGKPAMRVCRFCKAPNPVRLSECFECGSSLTAPNPHLPREGEATYPCLNCQGAIPFRANTCPHCGRTVTPAERSPEQRMRAATAPEGWEAKSLPDGSTVIHRSGWNRWNAPYINRFVMPVLLCAGFAFLVFARLMGGQDGEMSPAFYVLLATMGASFLGWFLLPLLLRDEVRVGQDFLETRRELGFYRSRRRIGRGYLRVKTEKRTEYLQRGRTRRYWVRALYVDGGGAPLLLQETRKGLSWDDEGLASFVLGSQNSVNFQFDEIAQLSVYLADITGWKLFDDAAGRVGNAVTGKSF